MSPAALRIENGEIIFQTFAGHEYVIDTGRTNIMMALGEKGTLDFLKTLMDRSMTDSLILANLNPLRRDAAAKIAAARAKEEAEAAAKEREYAAKRAAGEPGGFANRADRAQHEKTIRRLEEK